MITNKTNANINNITTDSISHISKTDSSIIFDNIILTININGIANKKITPIATNFLAFPIRAKTARNNCQTSKGSGSWCKI